MQSVIGRVTKGAEARLDQMFHQGLPTFRAKRVLLVIDNFDGLAVKNKKVLVLHGLHHLIRALETGYTQYKQLMSMLFQGLPEDAWHSMA